MIERYKHREQGGTFEALQYNGNNLNKFQVWLQDKSLNEQKYSGEIKHLIILSKKYPWGWIYIPKNHWVVRDGVGGLKEYSAKTFHELYSKDGEKR